MPSPTSVHWLSLVGSVWLQTINGPNSDFPVYSSELKKVKGISQVQLNFLAFASDAGKLFGWFSGVAALYVPLPLVAFVGASFGLVGYGVQYLFLDSPGLKCWHLFLLTALAGNGICWINTVCYLLCIKNFASRSRVAVSLATRNSVAAASSPHPHPTTPTDRPRAPPSAAGGAEKMMVWARKFRLAGKQTIEKLSCQSLSNQFLNF